MKSFGLSKTFFVFVIPLMLIVKANANVGTIDSEPTIDTILPSDNVVTDQSQDADNETNFDYDWVYLNCFHDSSVNKKCPQTAKANGYKWAMIKGECARSYWKCYGSN